MSSSKYLPAVVAQEGMVRLQQAILTGDPRMVEWVIAWGYEGIDRAFNPDPLFAPLDGVRRHRAKREWQQIVRGMQRQLQEVMAQKQVEAFTYKLDRGLDELKYQDAECTSPEDGIRRWAPVLSEVLVPESPQHAGSPARTPHLSDNLLCPDTPPIL